MFMRGVSWLHSKFLSRSRLNYNSRNFRRSLLYSKIAYLLSEDRNSLDLIARSHLRKRKYVSAANAYRKADQLGFTLLDHNQNQLRSELKSNNFIEAYEILTRFRDDAERENKLKLYINNFEKISDLEKIEILTDLSNKHRLPNSLREIIPWFQNENYENKKLQKSNNFLKITNKNIFSDREKRELVRIKNSGAYLISALITSSIRSPKKFITLPFSLPILTFNLVLKRKGLRSNNQHISSLDDYNDTRDCIVFFPTNGVGFGHFTRLISIALRVKKMSPKTDIVFFTSMPTINILTKYGFTNYHLPGRYRYDSMSPRIWNSLCEEFLHLINSIHRPKAYIFDGAYPYRGLINFMNSIPKNISKIWVRRGMVKQNSKQLPVDSVRCFDAIIQPGDTYVEINDDSMNMGISIVRVNPILLMDREDMLPEGRLRGRFGIPKEAILCYLQLGAGNINEINSEINLALNSLLKYPENYVLIGESMIGDEVIYEHPRVRIIRDYPNFKYFKDIDFALIAGGYNTYHEIIEAGIPSICYPNHKTGRDDQLGRVKKAKDSGSMIVVEKRNRINIDLSITRIMDSKVRTEMRLKTENLRKDNGASDAAKWICENT